MQAQQMQIDTIANNLANVNTTGFKRSRAEFQDMLYQTLISPGTRSSAETRFPSGIQIGLGATSMLTAIAFKTAVSASLPPLGYLTALDKILTWAIFLVFLSMTEALVSGLLVLRDREDLALKLDRFFRVAAPLLLVSGWVLFWAGSL